MLFAAIGILAIIAGVAIGSAMIKFIIWVWSI